MSSGEQFKIYLFREHSGKTTSFLCIYLKNIMRVLPYYVFLLKFRIEL